ncbi:MAG: WXG100 family type VII secretion target [Labedaea sp.]
MTPRPRTHHDPTSTHHSTGHAPTSHGGGDGGSDGTRPHGGGGRGVGTHIEGIETMAGRLDATRGRLDGVASTVRGVNVGPQSMGLIGSGFTGAAQAHLRAAEEHVTRTTQAVDQAQRGTRGTAQAYRDTDAANASALSAIDSTTRPPTPHAPAGSTTSTAPASSTGAGTTAPSAPPTTHGGGGPGGPPGTGGPPPPLPPGGPGGGPPPSHPTAGGSSGTPVSWRDDLRNHFTPDELRELDTAMGKMAADPKRGEVPGSGQLTQHERELLARAQQLVVITPDTLMQKVIPPGALDEYLAGTVRTDPGNRFDANSVGGFVARQQDATHLHTPEQIIDGNRLDYKDTLFTDKTQPIHVMEFPAGTADYVTPYGAPFGGGSGTHSTWGQVQRAADDMITAADTTGAAPGSYRRDVTRWPFSGVGLTAHDTLGVPERTTPYHQIPAGAQIYEYSPSGTKVLVAEYGGAARGWQDMRTTP